MSISDDVKCELDIPEKWALLRWVIANTGEYDLARLEALKILEIAGIPVDQDYDVKNYAVMAAKNFVNDSDAVKELTEHHSDPAQ